MYIYTIYTLSLKLGMTLSTSFSFGAFVMLLSHVSWELQQTWNWHGSCQTQERTFWVPFTCFWSRFMRAWTLGTGIPPALTLTCFRWVGLKICKDMLALPDLAEWFGIQPALTFLIVSFCKDSNNFQGSALLVLVPLGRHPVPLVHTWKEGSGTGSIEEPSPLTKHSAQIISFGANPLTSTKNIHHPLKIHLSFHHFFRRYCWDAFSAKSSKLPRQWQQRWRRAERNLSCLGFE